MSKKAEACERCGHKLGVPVHGWRLGRSAKEDVLLIASESARRLERGDRSAKRPTAILDALWLAMKRSDDAALKDFETLALDYLKHRKPSERWAGNLHFAWSDNAAAMRLLIAEAERALSLEILDGGVNRRMRHLVTAVQSIFPYLVSNEPQDVDELAGKFEHAAQAVDGDPRLLAERSLVAAGVPRKEAHQKFAFLRNERARQSKKARDARGAKTKKR